MFTIFCFAIAALLGQASSQQVAEPADFKNGETPYRVIPTSADIPQPTPTDIGVENTLGTWLYSYKDCKTNSGGGAKGAIDDAYHDAWVLSNTPGVASKIDWNSAAALEFLGPPGLNDKEQAQIQAVLANTATVIYSYGNIYPFTHYIKVRCDDPALRCKTTCSPTGKPLGLIAYSSNSDPDDNGYPMINFCAPFFARSSLKKALADGSGLGVPAKYELDEYDNRAQSFLHELFHLDLAADSSAADTPNPRVHDLTIQWQTDDGIRQGRAYGPLRCKILARWDGVSDQFSEEVGFYVQRNADNLAYFALAKYITGKTGKYPHLPVVKASLLGPPWLAPPGTVFHLNGSTIVEATRSDSGSDGDLGSDDPSCLGDLDEFNTFNRTLRINSFSPDSAYPDSYNDEVSKWLDELEEAGSDPSDPGAAGGQQVAIASYINPLGDPSAWDRLIAYDSNKLSVLVANVLNGPDVVVDNAWKSVIDRAAASGKTIIGYVRTGYLGVSQQRFTTRLGSNDLADWASQIEQDVDKWYELYGGSLGGIFFDEGWPECGPKNMYADLYAYINDYTKRKHPGAYTVLNPGSPIASCYEETMDTLLTFEQPYSVYKSSFTPNDWTPKDPRRIWHIIYDVKQDQIEEVAALSRERGIGLVEFTDDVLSNPYDNLPSEAYMQASMNVVSGGEPPIEEPRTNSNAQVAGLPGDTSVASSDYSSVTLRWSQVGGALGYAIYQNGNQVLELPAYMTRATVGMLQPGSSGLTFEVRAVMSSSGGGSSRVVTASTTALPSNGTITNVAFTRSGDTVTYTADVLVPYAFVRLFISGPQPDVGGSGWPLTVPELDKFGRAQHKLVNYLIEGNDFFAGCFKYTGGWEPGEGNNAPAAWSWASIGEAKLSQSGYTYTWKVPFAGTDAEADQYVVQGQGYAPLTMVFVGELRSHGTVP